MTTLVASDRNSYTRTPNPKFLLAFLFFLAFWTISIAVTYRQGMFKGLAYPANTPLPAPETRFGDFFGPYTYYVLDRGISAGMYYFPSIYLIAEFLYQINPDPWSVLPFYIFIWPLFCVIFVAYSVIKKGLGYLTSAFLIALILFSYPSVFAFHTGNFEGLIGVALLLSAYFAFFGNWRAFGIVVGLAASLKGVPIGFLIIPLISSTVRDFLTSFKFALISAVTATAIPLIFLPKGFIYEGIDGIKSSIDAIRLSQDVYENLMVNSMAGVHYGHSFLNTVHAFFGMETLNPESWGLFTVLVFAVVGVISAVFLRRYKSPLWMNYALLASIGCLAPATSTDYKLLYFMPAIYLFVLSDELRRFTEIPLILIIFIVSSKPWMPVGIDPWATASVYLTTLGMLLLIPILVLTARSLSSQISSRVDSQEI